MSYRDQDPTHPMREPTPTGVHPTGDRSHSPRKSVWGLVIGLLVLLILLGLAMVFRPSDRVDPDVAGPAMEEPSAAAPASVD